MFCPSCGKRIEDDIKYCLFCGNLNPDFSKINQKDQLPPQQIYQQQVPNQQNYILPQKKNNMFIIGLIGMLIIALITAGLFYFFNVKTITWIIALIIILIFSALITMFTKKNGAISVVSLALTVILIGGDYFLTVNILQNTDDNSNVSDGNIIIKSSIVSKGVNTDDLGNIMSGQYYFDDGQNQYYSTFDENQYTHIYKTSGNGVTCTPIFDGFGWSLVVKDSWLYFSGNQGQLIDGTYNLFRMRTDGSELQSLNTGYCYGMNIYNQWLYYIRKSSVNSTESYIYRCELDGSNETVIVSGNISYFIIFNDTLYYIINSQTLYKANPDGTNTAVVSTETIDKFIIGNGKIIYGNSSGNIKTMNIDGSDIKEIRAAGGNTIGSINSYKDHIYYTEYDLNFDYDLYAYKYWIHSVDFNGNNDLQVYEGYSWGFYVNLLNDKLFVLDYTRNSTSGNQIATTKNMTLSGEDLIILSR
ncbi:MAG: hypothetical protein A2Y17_02720 [Clostridiales bacterium GWF2_38_85]|nr:MAG: hypothetical protein A2Y17_02720 [Clostridiales bacterium GWF2_38_85]